MLDFAEFNNKPTIIDDIPCKSPACFVGSYPPVSKPGEEGAFFVNTYLLQPTRKFEVFGTVPVRSKDLTQ